MNTLDQEILDNTLALNHTLVKQNKIYAERIALLEEKVNDLTSSDDEIEEEHTDDSLSYLLAGIDIPHKDSSDPSTSIRTTESIVHELEQVQFDLIGHYHKKLTLSQVLAVLIQIYHKDQ